ncbi:MAG: hypothetical protein L3J05_07530 [Robiginitomaculum sp.]|nr:hypothetical protein [Robiginitomaculum sp.]
MPKYLLAFHGGKKFETKEQGMTHMTKWHAWMADIGDAAVGSGFPVGMSKTVSADGVIDNGGANPISGIKIIQAETMGAALKIAQSCPHLDIGGTIEIAEAMNMEM